MADARLLRDITPVGYVLELQPFLEEGEFQGHVTINLTCLEDTDKIIVNAHQELEITDGDVTVAHISSSVLVKKNGPMPIIAGAPITTAAPTPSTTITTTVPATSTKVVVVKTTEPSVAPVPVGAARLVPVSSSFIPENACLSATSCATNPGMPLHLLN